MCTKPIVAAVTYKAVKVLSIFNKTSGGLSQINIDLLYLSIPYIMRIRRAYNISFYLDLSSVVISKDDKTRLDGILTHRTSHPGVMINYYCFA